MLECIATEQRCACVSDRKTGAFKEPAARHRLTHTNDAILVFRVRTLVLVYTHTNTHAHGTRGECTRLNSCARVRDRMERNQRAKRRRGRTALNQ